MLFNGRRHSGFPESVLLPCGLFLRTVPVVNDRLAGKKILFFSDLHIRPEKIRSCGSSSPLKSWQGVETIGNALEDACNQIKPDYLIFGGDLVSRSVYLPDGFALLKRLYGRHKIAVPGNWDIRRRKWISSAKILQGFSGAGFRTAINQSFSVDGIHFTVLDDFKLGKPDSSAVSFDKESSFRILLTHNPDGISLLSEEQFRNFDLILSGHTHGGQIRLPFFGALKTSSKYWKFLEYGLYRWKKGPLLCITSGIGTTWIPVRLLCPPEILQIVFTRP